MNTKGQIETLHERKKPFTCDMCDLKFSSKVQGAEFIAKVS